MTLSRILVPVDFSAATGPLVQYAATLAGATGAHVELLHVLEPRPTWLAAAPPVACADKAAAKLRQLAAAPPLAALPVRTHVRTGDAEIEIVAAAADLGVDLLLIGSHGTSNLTRFLMGSVAEAVLRAAPCATLLVAATGVAEPVLP